MISWLRSTIIRLLPPPVNNALRAILQEHRARMQAAKEGVRLARKFSRSPRRQAIRAASRLYFAPRRRVLFYPRHPSKHQVYYKACALLGYDVIDQPDEAHDIAVHFYSGAFGDPSLLSDLPNSTVVLNRRSTDISKTTVEKVFGQVFGYALTVDPTSHVGLMVKKSDGNYTHDGQVLEGPLSADEVQDGYVYQKLVDNTDGNGYVVDLRAPVFGGTIPLVYRKRRPVASRFSNENTIVELCEPNEVFEDHELARILELAHAMHLDCGELDVLRDNDNGRVYVVDVNNTPSGPPNGLPPEKDTEAMERLSLAFEATIDAALTDSPQERPGP